jgi:hypothetical protein
MIDGVEQLFNKVIESVHCAGDELEFIFTDKTKYVISDHAQQCCEKRYMNTDDCLSNFHGAKFVNATIEDGPRPKVPEAEQYIDYGDVDSQFLIVTTTKGQFTVVNYNEHNGYYGGFDVVLREIK